MMNMSKLSQVILSEQCEHHWYLHTFQGAIVGYFVHPGEVEYLSQISHVEGGKSPFLV